MERIEFTLEEKNALIETMGATEKLEEVMSACLSCLKGWPQNEWRVEELLFNTYSIERESFRLRHRIQCIMRNMVSDIEYWGEKHPQLFYAIWSRNQKNYSLYVHDMDELLHAIAIDSVWQQHVVQLTYNKDDALGVNISEDFDFNSGATE